MQQALVDLVAPRQRLVEVERADRGADVGHGDVGDRPLEVLHFVGRLAGVEHLVEDDAVDGDRGIVLGDHGLARNLEHGLLHVELATDAVDIGDDEVEAGIKRGAIAAEALDRPLRALRHRFHAGGDRRQHEQREHDEEDQERAHPPPFRPSRRPFAGPRRAAIPPVTAPILASRPPPGKRTAPARRRQRGAVEHCSLRRGGLAP